MKKLFLWILIFIQPLLIAFAAGLSAILISGDQGEVAIALFLLVAIIGLIPGIFISILIYQKHLSSKQFED